MEFLPRIKAGCDAVINITTGGGQNMTVQQRLAARSPAAGDVFAQHGLDELRALPDAEPLPGVEYDWEPAYLEGSRDFIFKNTFKDIEYILEHLGRGCGTRFEFECYDVGHLYNLAHFVDRKLVEPPFFVQTIFGILGGIGADADHLLHMRRTADKLFGDAYEWSVLAAGRHQMGMATMAATMGGNVRVGLEDSVYIGKGELATSNAEQVAKIRRILGELSLEIATPGQARERPTAQRRRQRAVLATTRSSVLPPRLEWLDDRLRSRGIEAGDREHVARAADGDDSGAARDLAAQAADVDVERTVERRRLAAPGGPRQVVAQHLVAGMPYEVLEQVELDGGQLDVCAVDADLARRAFEPDTARFGDGRDLAIAREPAQHGAHPRHHLLGIERPADVVVGAAVERRDRVGGAGEERDHHDRQRAAAAELADGSWRVDARHRRVEQHQAIGIGGWAEAAPGVRLPRQPQAAGGARAAQQQRQIGPVRHQQHRRDVHRDVAPHPACHPVLTAPP